MEPTKIIILLSTYNGGKFLREQLDSIRSQDLLCDGGYSLGLLVRDDGSGDETLEILREYSKVMDIRIITGGNVGPAKSFWALLNAAPEAAYYAFCDQDDVWYPDKLSRAIHILEGKGNTEPQLYCSSVEWVDAALKPIRNKPAEDSTYTDFPHALLYSLSPGCTFVFNRKALIEARRYDFETNHVEIHDWLLHKIVSLLGEVSYDPAPSMYYRQHGNNAIGNKSESLAGTMERIGRFLTKDACVRSETAKSLLHVYGEDPAPDDRKRVYLDLVANYRDSVRKRFRFLKEKAFRRGFPRDILLEILILCGRI